MLSVTVLTVGKLKERYFLEACAEYQKRLTAFCKISVVEVEEYRLPDNPSPAQIEEGILQEGKRLAAKVPGGSFLITLCVEGRMLTSPELAREMERVALGGVSAITFVIGGSHGLWEELKARSGLRLSLSPMTLPHQLARVVVLEQIYRGMTINNNQKYHK